MKKVSFLFAFLFILSNVQAKTCEELQVACKKAAEEMKGSTAETCKQSGNLCTEAQKQCAEEARNEPKKRELLSSASAHHLLIRQTCRSIEAKKAE